MGGGVNMSEVKLQIEFLDKYGDAIIQAAQSGDWLSRIVRSDYEAVLATVAALEVSIKIWKDEKKI
jgi:hypothetical protein